MGEKVKTLDELIVLLEKHREEHGNVEVKTYEGVYPCVSYRATNGRVRIG